MSLRDARVSGDSREFIDGEERWALEIPCGHCGAKVGERCLDPLDRFLIAHNHRLLDRRDRELDDA